MPKRRSPAAAEKTTGTKKRGRRRSPPSQGAVSPEKRHRMVAEAAYFKAEQRGFSGGSSEQDWVEAAAEIDAMLAGSGPAPRDD